MLLVRIVIGKVAQMERLADVLRNVPIVQDDQSWNCVIWAKHAIRALRADGNALGTSELDWSIVRDAATELCRNKRAQHRFDGAGNFDMLRPATYDLLEGKELIA